MASQPEETYREEGRGGIGPVDEHGQAPGEPVAQRSNEGLQRSRGSDDDGGAQGAARGQEAREAMGEGVGGGEERRVQRGAQLVAPLLQNLVRLRSMTGIFFRRERESRDEASLTQVSQAPLRGPKASCQAGSRAWKYSSGWKKVASQKALMRRTVSRSRR